MIQIGPSAREETIGIVEKTDTATHAITAGQYVVWKGVGCVAASDISVGDTLSSSNLTAVSNGVANDIKNKIPSVSDSLSDTSTTNALSAAKGKALNDSISTLNTHITPVSTTASSEHTYQNRAIQFRKHAGCVTARIEGLMNVPQSQSTTMCTIPSGYEPIGEITDDRVVATGGTFVKVRLSAGAKIVVYNYGTAINDGNVIMTLTYACQ